MDVPGGLTSLFAGGAGTFFPYRIRNSIRWSDGGGLYARESRFPASSATTFSIAFWRKKADFEAASNWIFSPGQTSAGGNRALFGFNSFGRMQYARQPGGVTDWVVTATAAASEDPTSWAHYLYVFDSTQATSTDRVKMYQNGVRVAATGTFPTLNGTTYFSVSGYVRRFGGISNVYGANSEPGDMFAEFYLIDGVACVPEDFGLFKNGIFIPKPYEGTFGNVGWYWDFSDPLSEANLFLDKSPNAYSGFTINGGGMHASGFANIHRPEGPTDPEPATLDPLNANWGPGNYNYNWPTQVSNGVVASSIGFSLFAAPLRRGKWVWEWTHASSNPAAYGVFWETDTPPEERRRTNGNARTYSSSTGEKLRGPGSINDGAYGATYGLNDVIGTVVDLDAGTLEFFKNGVSQGIAYSDLPTDGESIVFPAFEDNQAGTGTAGYCNHYGSGIGRLAYGGSYPSDAKPLTRENIAATYLDERNALIWPPSRSNRSEKRTGTGAAAQIVTPTKPDLIFIKNLSTADGWRVVDSVRGVTKTLQIHSTAVEATEAQSVTALGPNYFDVGTLAAVNGGGNSILDMTWRRGATTGLDIVTYTGNGTADRTIAHALGRVPAFAIVKSLDAVGGWFVWHRRMTGANYFARLDTTAIESNTNSPWGTGGWTNIDFMVTADATNNANALGVNYVAYLFAEIEGYSRFTSYVGNGAASAAPVRFFGFLPEIVIMKTITGVARDWRVFTRAQNPINTSDLASSQAYLSQLAAAEALAPTRLFDWRAWGIRIVGGGVSMNVSGEKVIIAAWARAPYKYAMAA